MELRGLGNTLEAYALPLSEGGTGALQADYSKKYNAHRLRGASKKSARHAAWQEATEVLDRQISDKATQLGDYGAVYFARNKPYKVNR